jgi:hypothetical protein
MVSLILKHFCQGIHGSDLPAPAGGLSSNSPQRRFLFLAALHKGYICGGGIYPKEEKINVLLVLMPVVLVLFLSGIRIIRPTHRGLVERPGRYRRFAKPGFNRVVPIVDRMSTAKERFMKLHPGTKLAVVGLSFWGVILMFPQNGLEAQEQKAAPGRTVAMSTLEARITPHFEFTLPSGSISERIEQQFNNFNMAFTLDFNFFNSSIDADIAFSYPLGFFVPGIHFYQNVDLENLIAPTFQDGELSLLATDRYIARDRGIGADLAFHLTPAFSITPSFLMNDTFKGSFTTDLILDEGIDWVGRMSFVLDTGKSQPEVLPEPRHRIFFSSVFDMRFRDTLTNPASLDHSNFLQSNHRLWNRVFITESLAFNYPIYIWNEKISHYYSLGGFKTIRGYTDGSITAFRYLLNRIDLGLEVFPNGSVEIKVLKRSATMHDYRILFVVDGLLAQDHLSWDSEPKLYGGCGGGFACLLSGEKQQHIKVSTYIVQPLQAGRLPVVYFQTSFFNFEKEI